MKGLICFSLCFYQSPLTTSVPVDVLFVPHVAPCTLHSYTCTSYIATQHLVFVSLCVSARTRRRTVHISAASRLIGRTRRHGSIKFTNCTVNIASLSDGCLLEPLGNCVGLFIAVVLYPSIAMVLLLCCYNT